MNDKEEPISAPTVTESDYILERERQNTFLQGGATCSWRRATNSHKSGVCVIFGGRCARKMSEHRCEKTQTAANTLDHRSFCSQILTLLSHLQSK